MAKAKKESLAQKNEDHFLVSVREPAERNLANTRVLELLSLHFKVPKGKIRIVNGHQAPGKLIMVED